jgi:abortive infection bacteriophage resistance protein
MRYTKRALTNEQQATLLKSRGVVLDNEVDARHSLERTGYYHLSAYFIPFKVSETDQFLPYATFGKVLDLYQFDSRLRLLAMQAIDHIEVSVRASLTYKMGHQLGPFGYTNVSLFTPFVPFAGKGIPAQGFDHADFMAKLDRQSSTSKVDFVAHYRARYTSETHLPIWMVTELLTRGTISKMAGEVPKGFRKQMRRDYWISGSQFVSRIRCRAYVRNICAHHGGLWNRELSLKPELLNEWSVLAKFREYVDNSDSGSTK